MRGANGRQRGEGKGVHQMHPLMTRRGAPDAPDPISEIQTNLIRHTYPRAELVLGAADQAPNSGGSKARVSNLSLGDEELRSFARDLVNRYCDATRKEYKPKAVDFIVDAIHADRTTPEELSQKTEACLDVMVKGRRTAEDFKSCKSPWDFFQNGCFMVLNNDPEAFRFLRSDDRCGKATRVRASQKRARLAADAVAKREESNREAEVVSQVLAAIIQPNRTLSEQPAQEANAAERRAAWEKLKPDLLAEAAELKAEERELEEQRYYPGWREDATKALGRPFKDPLFMPDGLSESEWALVCAERDHRAAEEKRLAA